MGKDGLSKNADKSASQDLGLSLSQAKPFSTDMYHLLNNKKHRFSKFIEQ